MKVPVRQLIATAALSAALCAPAFAESDTPPQRKAGLWEITTVAPVSGMTTQKVCIGENDDIIRPEGSDCTEPTIEKLNEGTILTVECTTDVGTQVISSTFIGDFSKRYHGTLKTTFKPPLGAIRRMGVKIDGTYLGPDCPDDIEAENP